MKIGNIYFIFFICFAVLGILLFIYGTYQHEQVHVEIYRSYGIESKIYLFSLKYFPDAVTLAEEPCPTEECESLHNFNEIFFYNIQMIYFIIYLGFLFIIYFKVIKEIKNEQ